ncbi:hypothetical protein [Rickettsia endosymbiont of Urophora cardui]|uniref:hypothetical protein n=1 Tax=Rickettsia endosymbiont of Urophora cardui TaxID=3066265 RepID=UPI00313CFE90
MLYKSYLCNKAVIRPPNSSVKVQSLRDKTERDAAVIYQQNKGYQAWRVKNNYGRRERVENTFFRFKRVFCNDCVNFC